MSGPGTRPQFRPPTPRAAAPVEKPKPPPPTPIPVKVDDLHDVAVVAISRLWGAPKIHVWADKYSIGMRIPMDDYLVALAKEMSNPAFVFTRKQLLASLRKASLIVEAGVKQTSARV
jgi:hypothetical protein